MSSAGRTPLLGLTFTSDAAMNANLARIEHAVSDARSAVTTSITTPTVVQPGDGFIQGGLFCIALSDGQPNDLIMAQITGVAAVKKAGDVSESYQPGDEVRVDENGHARIGGPSRIGTAAAVSGGSETTVRTLLQPGMA